MPHFPVVELLVEIYTHVPDQRCQELISKRTRHAIVPIRPQTGEVLIVLDAPNLSWVRTRKEIEGFCVRQGNGTHQRHTPMLITDKKAVDKFNELLAHIASYPYHYALIELLFLTGLEQENGILLDYVTRRYVIENSTETLFQNGIQFRLANHMNVLLAEDKRDFFLKTAIWCERELAPIQRRLDGPTEERVYALYRWMWKILDDAHEAGGEE